MNPEKPSKSLKGRVEESIKEYKNELFDILKNENECDKFVSEEEVTTLVNPQMSESCRGVYIFLDKNTQHCYYVGEGGCAKRKGKYRPMNRRVYYHMNHRRKNNLLKFLMDKHGWGREEAKCFIKENISFCFKILDDIKEVKRLERLCIVLLKPEFNA